MLAQDLDPASQPAERPPRRRALLTLAFGLVCIVAPFAVIGVSALAGASSSVFLGLPLVFGWIVTGFGIGELIFAGRYRIAVMLLALLIGIAGLALTATLIAMLGFSFAR